ncbi:MAG: HugZ family protein [Actinomycetota bacterium]|nr:DUF2470 domain-containing protein [Acidimicrobiales bacterium]
MTDIATAGSDDHGGGGAGPTIAGDPSSFPNDAELARTLTQANSRATLSTLTSHGYPYGSVVSYVATDNGSLVLLISDVAEHTINVRQDSRSSMLIADDSPVEEDQLGKARLTLLGRLSILTDPGKEREMYLREHPYASLYADFSDFNFWLFEIKECRYVGGFGHMSWVDAENFISASPDVLHKSKEGIIKHMNDDHAAANLTYVRLLAGLPEATSAAMVDVDRYGMTLVAALSDGSQIARVPFLEPLTGPEQAQGAVIALLDSVRGSSE